MKKKLKFNTEFQHKAQIFNGTNTNETTEYF